MLDFLDTLWVAFKRFARKYGGPLNAAAPTLTLVVLVLMVLQLNGVISGGQVSEVVDVLAGEVEERSYSTGVYLDSGGDRLVVQSGGEIEMQSGATLDIQSGTTTDFSGGVDLDGAQLVIDADGDTSLTADTDDQLDLEIAGADVFTFMGANAAASSSDLLDVTSSTGIMDGTDAWIGLDVNLTGADHTGTGNTITALDIDLTTADANATETALGIDDTDFDIGIDSAVGIEHIGLPSVASAAITYQSSGAIFTVTDGEIWLVHRVILNVTANFDCTGDDCTLDVGDGNDVDGWLDMADAHLQAAAVDITDMTAGWMGLDAAAPSGAFQVAGGPGVYAPSGADETIDIAVGGTSPAAGTGTLYIIYTRIQ